MRTTILIFLALSALSCGTEPQRFDEESDGDFIDSGPDSDSDSDLPDSETETDTDTDTNTGSSDNSDSGTDGDVDTDSDIDTETETGSDTATETDSESATGTETNDDTEHDTDTQTDEPDSGLVCPWSCHELTETGYDTCDTDTESPAIVQNHNFSCSDDYDICCQPLESDLPGAIHDYCNDNGLECHTAGQCNAYDIHNEYYCKNATLVCCSIGGAKRGKSAH